jgi:hypothetical protein
MAVRKDRLGEMAHTCNPSYLGDGDREDWDLRSM